VEVGEVFGKIVLVPLTWGSSELHPDLMETTDKIGDRTSPLG